jgi:mRNA-degrading endonuclease RelE of RelBE toxin-antitoxin system
LIANPHRVGHPLERELEGWYSARIGAYRVIYWIDKDERIVYVDRVDHRSNVYRPK